VCEPESSVIYPMQKQQQALAVGRGLLLFLPNEYLTLSRMR